MIPLFISSKNRPSQLRLLLESIGVNTNSLFDITVLYKYDSSGYKLGYEKLKEEKILSNLTFVEEEQGVNGNFLNQMREYITSAGKLFSLMVDDNIVYRNIDATTEEIEEQFTDDVFCVSLRLGKNTTVANHLKPHIETPLQEFQKRLRNLLSGIGQGMNRIREQRTSQVMDFLLLGTEECTGLRKF